MQPPAHHNDEAKFRWFLAAPLILYLGLTGCGIKDCCLAYKYQDAKGAVHYLILGIGLVTIPEPANDTAVFAARVHALGMTVSDQPGLKFSMGYSSSSVVKIANGAEDVRVEISQVPGGPLEIEAHRAQLTKR